MVPKSRVAVASASLQRTRVVLLFLVLIIARTVYTSSINEPNSYLHPVPHSHLYLANEREGSSKHEKHNLQNPSTPLTPMVVDVEIARVLPELQDPLNPDMMSLHSFCNDVNCANHTTHFTNWNFTMTTNGTYVHGACIQNNWAGIVCNSGRVIELDTYNYNITGNFGVMGYLSNMTSLQTLTLGANRLYGEVPSALNNMTSLKIIDITSNNLHGPIALCSLAELSSFEKIEVSQSGCTCYESCWSSKLAKLSGYSAAPAMIQCVNTPQPTVSPTFMPSSQPSAQPSREPTGQPTSQPTSSTSMDTEGLEAFCAAVNCLSHADIRSTWDFSKDANGEYTSHPCANNWKGIACEEVILATVTEFRVSSIALFENTLVGTLSPQLSLVKYLSTLILNGNSISGSIPSTYNNMSHLAQVNLAANQLSGNVNLCQVATVDIRGQSGASVICFAPCWVGNTRTISYSSGVIECGLTPSPSFAPTEQPTPSPTASPTEQPSPSPTEQPTPSPTAFPTEQPSPSPSEQPTPSPTVSPTEQPTENPTTANPTAFPTVSPTAQPSNTPPVAVISLNIKMVIKDVSSSDWQGNATACNAGFISSLISASGARAAVNAADTGLRVSQLVVVDTTGVQSSTSFTSSSVSAASAMVVHLRMHPHTHPQAHFRALITSAVSVSCLLSGNMLEFQNPNILPGTTGNQIVINALNASITTGQFTTFLHNTNVPSFRSAVAESVISTVKTNSIPVQESTRSSSHIGSAIAGGFLALLTIGGLYYFLNVKGYMGHLTKGDKGIGANDQFDIDEVGNSTNGCNPAHNKEGSGIRVKSKSEQLREARTHRDRDFMASTSDIIPKEMADPPALSTTAPPAPIVGSQARAQRRPTGGLVLGDKSRVKSQLAIGSKAVGSTTATMNPLQATAQERSASPRSRGKDVDVRSKSISGNDGITGDREGDVDDVVVDVIASPRKRNSRYGGSVCTDMDTRSEGDSSISPSKVDSATTSGIIDTKAEKDTSAAKYIPPSYDKHSSSSETASARTVPVSAPVPVSVPATVSTPTTTLNPNRRRPTAYSIQPSASAHKGGAGMKVGVLAATKAAGAGTEATKNKTNYKKGGKEGGDEDTIPEPLEFL